MEKREYNLPNELKRGVFYIFIFVWIASSFQIVRNAPPTVKIDAMFYVMNGLILTGSALLLILALRWRIVINNNGIAKRFLWSWNKWSWDIFESGKVHQMSGSIFYCPEKALFDRSFSFELLSTSEKAGVKSQILKHWRLPELPGMADKFLIKTGNLFRGRIIVDREGMTLERMRSKTEANWINIKKVVIWKETHEDVIFNHIEISTEYFEFSSVKTPMRVTSIPDKGLFRQRLLTNLLSNNLRKDSFIEVASAGKPKTKEEVEIRRKHLLSRKNEFTKIKIFAPIVFAIYAPLSLMFFSKSTLSLIPVAVMLGLVLFVNITFEKWQVTTPLAKLSEWDAELMLLSYKSD